LGLFVSINQRLDAETLNLVAEEFRFEVEFVSVEVQEAIDGIEVVEEDESKLLPRAPIVTVMGHVDHGKTKLLDYIRKSNVVAGEAGGITQHIGAYEVILEDGKNITFLDTPGHEAFTAMRARGAKVTDIAIIIIAADDDVMPQTKEAINHAQAAGVPIIFAINKIDRPNANAEKIKQQLSEMNILVEDWGGKYQSQDISATEGTNIDELLEKVLLEAEMLDLKANPEKNAIGTVIESSLDKGRGYVTNVLVQAGTLHVGDMILAGSLYGKIKAMYNERNQLIKEAGPSVPLLLLGLNGAPQAGDGFNVIRNEREAKSIANKREQLQREQGLRTTKHVTLDEIGRRIAIGDFKELNIIVKGDVDGSVEALSDSLLKLSTEEVQLNIILKGVGAVTETDVMLASASNAIIIGFQVRPQPGARKLAELEQIDIRLYSIIYQAIEEIKSAIEGMLAPNIEEKITCNLEVREVYKITKVGTVAGCMVLDGKITRKTTVRLIRDGIVVYTGVLGSLKRFKDDAKEVATGYECGMNIENFNDIKVGDIIEGYEEIEIKRTL
jgi:translation initiation factor IF-2